MNSKKKSDIPEDPMARKNLIKNSFLFQLFQFPVLLKIEHRFPFSEALGNQISQS
jgi:hypothetical protein